MKVEIFNKFLMNIILTLVFLSKMNAQDTLRIPSYKEIKRAKGQISIEKYYPVDSKLLQETVVYLDSSLKFTTDRIFKGRYQVKQIIAIDFIPMYKILKKKPFFYQLDSVLLTKKEFDISIQYAQIINAILKYKKGNNIHVYKFENGFLHSIEVKNKSESRLKGVYDLSTLYKIKDKKWPIATNYFKNGKVKSTTTYFFYDRNFMMITY
jgi:hypothetical protein